MIKNTLDSSVDPKFGALPINEGALTYLLGDTKKFAFVFGQPKLTQLDNAVQETVAWFRSKVAVA